VTDLTLAELAQVLDPPLTEHQLRQLVTLTGLKPSGKRRTGRAGRPQPTYEVTELLKLHAVLAPFLGISDA